MRHLPSSKYAMILGLIIGVFIGMMSAKSATATPQWSFGGYDYAAQQNQGTRSDIGYTDPYTPKGQSLE